MKRVLWLFLTALCLGTARAQEPPPVPISHWRDVVRAYDKGIREDDVEARRVAADGFRSIRSVRDEQGQVFRPETTIARNRLERLARPGQDVGRDDRLHAATYRFLSELGKRPTKTDPAADARKILSASEFRNAARGRSDRSPAERWLAEQLRKLEEWLARAFGRMPRGNGQGLESFALTMRLFLYFFGGVLAIVVAWQVYRMAREGGWIRKRRVAAQEAPDDLIAESILDPLADASIAEQSGDLRLAIRLVYIATLRLLRERGWIALEANRTNWEYQHLLARRSSELATRLRPATIAFDRVWYGGRAGTVGELELLRECYRRLSEVIE